MGTKITHRNVFMDAEWRILFRFNVIPMLLLHFQSFLTFIFVFHNKAYLHVYTKYTC